MSAWNHYTYVLVACAHGGEPVVIGVWYDLDSATAAHYKTIYLLESLGLRAAVRVRVDAIRSNGVAFEDFVTFARGLQKRLYGRMEGRGDAGQVR